MRYKPARRHAPYILPEIADLTFDDVMRLEPADIEKLFKGVEPFVRIPVHMWEDLTYFINEALGNLEPMELEVGNLLKTSTCMMGYKDEDYLEPLSCNVSPETEMCWAEFGRNKSGLIETLNRIKNQVPGAARGVSPTPTDTEDGTLDTRQGTINGT